MRKRYVDYFRALAMILVILGHINFANEAVKGWIYAFHMPAFFFASGLIIRPEKTDRKYLEKKSRRLLLPYLLWGLIYADFSWKNLALLLYGSYHSISVSGSLTSLWFLPAMFLALLLSQEIFKITKEKRISLLAGALLLILLPSLFPAVSPGYPWCLNAALCGSGFLLLGYLLGRTVGEKTSGKWDPVFLILGFGLTQLYRWNPVPEENYVLMANGRTGNPLLFLAAAAGGCFMLYGLARILDRYSKDLGFLSRMGRNTLLIFVLQKPVILLFEKLFSRILLPAAAELVITAAATAGICCLLAEIIGKLVPALGGYPSAADKK